MNLKHTLLGFGLAVVACAPLAAQQPTGWQVGGALSYSSGMSLKNELTNQDLGYILNGGYVGKLASSDVDFRTSVAMEFFPGSTQNQVKHSLNGFQVAGDIFVNTPLPQVHIITGISLNKWSLKNTDPLGSWTDSVKGIKFGGRIGVDYVVNKQWSAEVLMQVIELGTDQELINRAPNGDQWGIRSIAPSWVQFGVTYHF